ncbi:MAG: hypothetical protein Q9221_006707 [Calogaya cf. arnoldii]
MQCLGSPTREEIDRAHAKRRWLDVGVPSVRNLRNISPKRAVTWFLLAISSVPLALMYNSVVFKSLDSNDYHYFLVTDTWVTAKEYDREAASKLLANLSDIKVYSQTLGNELLESLWNNIKQLERLDNKECIQEYSKRVMTGRRNLRLVTYTDNVTPAIQIKTAGTVKLSYSFTPFNRRNGGDPLKFICSGKDVDNYKPYLSDCTSDLVQAGNWLVKNFKINYCLSEKVEENCRLESSRVVWIVVVICNGIK